MAGIEMTLRVEPEALKNKSYDMVTDIENMSNDIKRMTESMEDTSGYWLGNAGNAQRDQYMNRLEEMNALIERLRTYPVRILKMAKLYDETEYNNVIIAVNQKTTVNLV